MKKLMIILCLAGTALAASAQKDTTKKAPKVFQVDLSKTMPMTFTVNVPASRVYNYLSYEAQGIENLKRSPKITALQLTTIDNDHYAVADSINMHIARQLNAFILSEKAKWAADTGKAVRHKVFPKKKA